MYILYGSAYTVVTTGSACRVVMKYVHTYIRMYVTEDVVRGGGIW